MERLNCNRWSKMEKIHIGCAQSELSRNLAGQLAQCLHCYHPELTVELVPIKNTGDGEEPALIARRLEQALIDCKIDLAVCHALNLPLELHPELPVVAISARKDARDALVFPQGKQQPDFSKPIGCISRRQQVQLHRVFPDCITAPVGGTVAEQLARLDQGEYGALVLPAAQLGWFGLQQRVGQLFCVEELVPAAGHAAVAVQAREEFDAGLLECFHSWDSWDAVFCEREFARALEEEPGPIAVYAEVKGETLSVVGFYADEAEGIYRMSSMSGDRKDAGRLGFELAAELKIG